MLTQPLPIQIDDFVSELRSFIAEGNYAPNDRLPAERELISRLGVTRATLRKGLDALERDGAIWRHVGKGTFVGAHGGRLGSSNLADLSTQITPIQLMRARIAFEPSVAREAAISASDEAVTRIKIANDRAKITTNWDDYEAQDNAFHRAVVEASGNILLLSLFDQLNQVRRAVTWSSVQRSAAIPPPKNPSFVEHDAIVKAIGSRDPAAAHTAMREHRGAVSTRLFGGGGTTVNL